MPAHAQTDFPLSSSSAARSAKDEALRRRCKTSLVFAGVAVVAFVLFTDFVPERVIDVMLEDE